MTTQTIPDQYRPAQIFLHWVVVLGVIIQFANNESIVRVKEAMSKSVAPVAADNTFAWVHVGVGTAILLAVLARLYMRFRYGAPGHVPGTPPLQATLATFMHWALYVLLLAMVITGMLTWNGIASLGGVHFILGVSLFFLVLGHAGAGIYNQFVRKDGTMRRMWSSRSQ